VVLGSAERIPHMTPRALGGNEARGGGGRPVDQTLERKRIDGLTGGAWGRLEVTMQSDCDAVVRAAPDALAASYSGFDRALGVASAARDLPALEALMVRLMRRGGEGGGVDGGGDRDPAAAEAIIDAAAAAAWRVASSSGPGKGLLVRRGTMALIRRAVQWHLARGDLDGAYSLAHLTGDRTTLEDVYCAALSLGSSAVMAAVRDSLAYGELEPASFASGGSRQPLPSAEELCLFASLEARAALNLR
jgi:hypothetical protein